MRNKIEWMYFPITLARHYWAAIGGQVEKPEKPRANDSAPMNTKIIISMRREVINLSGKPTWAKILNPTR